MENESKIKGEKLAKEWGVGMLFAFVAFFASISANGLFSILHGSDRLWLDLVIIVVSSVVAMYLANFVKFGFENIAIVKNKKTCALVKFHIESKIKR